jgi:prepilin-type N-terminal cleavage/methylation domain-containing protein
MRIAKKTFTHRAFTIIELLVVISIIAVLAAGVGIALRGGNPDASLRSAQSLVVGALASARGQAALNQSNARILVQANSSDENFLRSIRVVIRDPITPSNWKQVGSEIILPEGVYVMPPTYTLGGVFFESQDNNWNSGRNSSFLSLTTASADLAGLANAATCLVSRDISPLGAVIGGGGRIVVTTGRRTGPATITLDNSAAVRGLAVSVYGIAGLVNEPGSFDLMN